MFLFFLVFFGLQIFVLFCCAAAGNDAALGAYLGVDRKSVV